MRFIADTMLGTLAKWLRVFGYDVLYAKAMDDDDIIRVASKEERIIISRDKELCGRMPGSILLHTIELDVQIVEVLKKYTPNKDVFLTRCVECNAILVETQKNGLSGIIPRRVLEAHDEFLSCPECGRAFWKGSHYDNMVKKAEELLAQCLS